MATTTAGATLVTPYYRFPTLDAPDNDLRSFASRHFAWRATYRMRHMQRIAKALYYALGKQWITLDIDVVDDGRGFVMRQLTDEMEPELPRPVRNVVAPAIDVEFATLSKRQWEPKVPTYSRDPRMEAAAKVADDVLHDRLKKLGWPDLRDRFILNVITMGTGILRSWWEENFYETSWVAVPEPYRCPQCEQLFASNRIPQALLTLIQNGSTASVRDIADTGEEPTDMVEMANCPGCAAQAPLEPADLDEEQSRGSDMFGRPLGEDLPKGGTNLELITPFEYYPENGGVGVSPETARMHGICKVRSLDWIEEHFPDLIDQVQPEPQEVLLQEHPLLGEHDIIGRLDVAMDAGIYDHHARVYDLYHDPSYRFPQGRMITLIGGTQQLIARNDKLVRTITEGNESANVPHTIVKAAIWKPREGEFWGKALPDDIISPQNQINGIIAQTIEARERMGSPNIFAPADAEISGPAYRAGYGLGKIFTWQPSPISPTAKPEVFGSVLMPAGVYNEMDRAEQSVTKIVGPADIEIGEAPRNITTTSGLQILGEQAERRRATRERGITSAFQAVWEHQLSLLWVLRTDLDTYEARLPDGSFELKQYSRESICGMTRVEIERQAYIDRSIIQREKTREALLDRLYDPSTPTARKKLLELMDLPTDVNEDTNLQIEHARRQWVDFVDDQKIPVIDTSIDDPAIRFSVLGTMLLQDEGRQLSEQALWPQILPIIAGWEELHQAMSAQDALARQKYGGEPPPEQAAEMYAKFQMAYQEAKSAYDTQIQHAQQNPVPGQPPPGPPPPEPPPPIFIPKQPEQRVYLVWRQMIQNKGGIDPLIQQAAVKALVMPEQMAQVVDLYLRFRAVVEAYRLLSPPMPMPGSMPGGPGEMPASTQTPPGMEPQGPAPTPATPPQPPTAVR
jgi:uncharacterized protein YbdZ (MbtH family)